MPERIAKLSAAMAVGDSEAVDAFYREYFDWMYGQARRVTRRDESFCLDVVQDAVLRVIRTVKPVEDEGRFRGWLQLVVKTTAFDLLRSERRRKNREAMMGIAAAQSEVDVDSLQLDWLQEQITRLDPEIVKIIELRFAQSWTLRRIGERLGVSIGAVDGRLRRALTHLRLAAEESPVDPPASTVPSTESTTEPGVESKSTTNEAVGAGAAAAIAPDADLVENVDQVAPPVGEFSGAVETAVVSAAISAVVSAAVEQVALPGTATELPVHVVAPPVAEVAASTPRDEGDTAIALQVETEPQTRRHSAAGLETHSETASDSAPDTITESPVGLITPPVINHGESSAGNVIEVSGAEQAVEVLPDAESHIEIEAEPQSGEMEVLADAAIEFSVTAPARIAVFPAIAARSLAADSSVALQEYAVAIKAGEVTEFPELIGLEDEAGWYDDWL